MKTTFLIFLLLHMSFGLFAQAIPQDSLKNLGFVVTGLFKALDQDNHNLMAQQLSEICLPDAGFDAINYNNEGLALQKTGSLKDFVSNTGEFYSIFDINREEIQRGIIYYADFVHVASIVYEVIEQSATGTLLEDRVLYSINAVYIDNRWYISQVSWVSESDYLPFERYHVTDTLTVK